VSLSLARRLVQFGLLLLLGGLAAAIITSRQTISEDLSTGSELAIYVAALIAGIGLLVAWLGWRTLRLASPGNTIANWTIPPDQWQLYVAACQMREKMAGALSGTVPLNMESGNNGVEVIAMRKGFRVGDTFHEVGTIGAETLDMRRADSPAHMFEFNIRYTTSKTSSMMRAVRIPIATDAFALADQIEDYWVKRQPLLHMPIEQLRDRVKQSGMLALGNLMVFVGTMIVLSNGNAAAWVAILPIAAMSLAGYGFARWITARNELMRRG
jgi:hypothetical protein